MKTHSQADPKSSKVLVCVGSRADAYIVEEILTGVNAESVYCDVPGDLCAAVLESPDAIVVTDEVLTEELVAALADTLRTQPESAEIPLLLIAPGAQDSRLAMAALDRLENVLLLDRPVHLLPLRSAIGMALRTRAKQLQIRDLLEEQRRTVARLNRLTDDLTRSNEDLERFSYVASHDLREPLRVIIGFAQLLDKRSRDDLNEEAKEFLHYITDAATRMDQLIVDLLRFARMGKEADVSGEVDLGRVLDAALDNLKQGIEESGVAIRTGALPTVRGNATLLAQVFQNLIANAIKFKKDEPLVIDIGAERKGPEWLIYVRDNGIGFDRKDAERVFEVFQRLHAKDKYGGTGIGLTICKRAIELHGGRIWAESERGKGATFYFTMPVGVENAERS